MIGPLTLTLSAHKNGSKKIFSQISKLNKYVFYVILSFQAGLVGEVLQLGFPQRVSPGSRCRVTGYEGPWGGLMVGDLVGAICPPSLGEV